MAKLENDERIIWLGTEITFENLWSVVPITKNSTKEYWERFQPNSSLLTLITDKGIMDVNIVRFLEKGDINYFKYSALKSIKLGEPDKTLEKTVLMEITDDQGQSYPIKVMEKEYWQLTSAIVNNEIPYEQKLYKKKDTLRLNK